jgi:thiamine-phosphate pyrophosphorylase
MSKTIAKASLELNFQARKIWPRASALAPMILMTDPKRLADPQAILDILPKGAAVKLGAQIRAACRRRGLVFICGGSQALAQNLSADGLHIPQWQIVRGKKLRRPKKNWIVTAACHSYAAIQAAAKMGADAAILSPVFPTESHIGAATLGPLRFACLVHHSPIPVYGLGGIDSPNAQRIIRSGACGLAGIGAFSE